MTDNLRTYIRFLVEAAVGGEQAASGGLALYRKVNGNKLYYTLYDAKSLVAVADEPGFLSMRVSKPIDEIVFGAHYTFGVGMNISAAVWAPAIA